MESVDYRLFITELDSKASLGSIVHSASRYLIAVEDEKIRTIRLSPGRDQALYGQHTNKNNVEVIVLDGEHDNEQQGRDERDFFHPGVVTPLVVPTPLYSPPKSTTTTPRPSFVTRSVCPSPSHSISAAPQPLVISNFDSVTHCSLDAARSHQSWPEWLYEQLIDLIVSKDRVVGDNDPANQAVYDRYKALYPLIKSSALDDTHLLFPVAWKVIAMFDPNRHRSLMYDFPIKEMVYSRAYCGRMSAIRNSYHLLQPASKALYAPVDDQLQLIQDCGREMWPKNKGSVFKALALMKHYCPETYDAMIGDVVCVVAKILQYSHVQGIHKLGCCNILTNDRSPKKMMSNSVLSENIIFGSRFVSMKKHELTLNYRVWYEKMSYDLHKRYLEVWKTLATEQPLLFCEDHMSVLIKIPML